MGKQPVLAYSIAGVAVAIAIAVVAASTLGLTGASEQAVASTVAGPALEVPVASGQVPAAAPDAADAGGVEYVYVDEPQTGYDDDDADHEREEDERERHDDDDDHERGGLLGLFRGDHDDDDDD